MKRAEALTRIAQLHQDWSLKWGDAIEPPSDGGEDSSVWSADAGATAEQQDELNGKIMQLLAQIDDGENRSVEGEGGEE